MAPGRRKGSSGKAAADAAAKAQQYKVGDLVLAKMKGFPAWPAVISEPEQWGYAPVRKKLLVYFYGTKQIAFCNYADIEAFTEEKKKSLLLKRQGKGADFIRALNEIIHIYDTLKNQTVQEASLAIEEIKADTEVKECLRSNSLRKSRKGSCKAADNDLEVALALDNHNDNHGVSPTSTENNSLQNELSNGEPTGEVSIIDRLMKSPLETSTSSRKKKLRGASQNNTLSRKRTPRTLSSSSTPKNGDSDLLDCLNLSGTDFNHGTQEDPLHKHSSSSSDINDVVVQDSFKLNTNIGNEDAETEQVAKGYESSNMDEKKMVESSQAVKIPVNGCLNTEVPSNGKLDLLKTIVFCKKKRKSNRKPLNTYECMRQNKEQFSQLENCSSDFNFSNCRNAMAEQVIMPDGDEHLPLVKRARVRMEKTGEELQLSVLSNIMEKPETKESTSNFDNYCASPTARTSEGSFKDANPSPVNNMSVPSAKSDVVFWKTKYGFEMDAEAALPPSKRLHRALEAMSANAAEAKDGCSESPEAPESIGCLHSQAISSLHICMDDTAQKTSLNIQPFVGSNEHKSNLSIFSSESTDATALSSEVKCDSALSIDCSGMQIECKGILEDAAKYSEISMPCNNTDIENKVLKPCCSSNEVNATLYKGANNQIFSPLGQENESEVMKEESHNSSTNNVLGDATRKSVIMKKECVLKSDGLTQSFHLDGCYTESLAGAVATAINTSQVTNADRFHTDGELESCEMQDIATECKPRLTPYQTRISPDLTPMKELIAAAQARRLPSCSFYFTDNNVDTRLIVESLASPVILKEDISGRVSPPKCPVSHPIVEDDRTNNVYRGGGGSSNAGHQLKGLMLSIDLESNTVKKSFETFICTLTRTKESIGRATRMAIDCAKYGIAREVIDILLQNLEREPSLHRRIDLFFLIDSITQCSRNLKGGAGNVYPSLIQSVLPRLLSAAAPRGNAAFENRRQCLKVLKLWLERRTLPEAMIRHHIRELNSVDEVLLASSSRRPSRTERAFNDPVREMEGMLVDEYGSNTGFQLSCLNFNVLDDEEGSASDEKTLEAVTPERVDEVDHEKRTTQVHTEKHRHVLEAIDGELEMEDVAPTCQAQVISSNVAGVDDLSLTHPVDKHYSSSFIPPLPENSPPSPPPLPSSPPPSSPCTTDGLVLEQQMRLPPIGEPADLHFSGANNVIQMSQLQPLGRHPAPNSGLVPSESMTYYGPGYEGHHMQMPPPISSNISSGFGNFSVPQPALHSQNSCLPLATTPVPNKAYTVQPPPPTISNNFSYVQAETQQKPRPWGNCSSFPERLQYAHDGGRGNCYGDQGNSGRYHNDMIERDKFSPLLRPGPSHCEKVDMPPPACHYGPSEPPRLPSNEWLPCPRVSNYYPMSTTRPSVDGPTAPLAGAPAYWRPR